MTLPEIRAFLLWCTLFNAGLLTIWFLMFAVARDWIYRLHSRWFPIPRERFDAIHYALMAAYKTGIILFNLVPWLALLVVGRNG
jgi:hypothetical protein